MTKLVYTIVRRTENPFLPPVPSKVCFIDESNAAAECLELNNKLAEKGVKDGVYEVRRLTVVDGDING